MKALEQPRGRTQIEVGRQQQAELRRLERTDRDAREAALGQCPCKIERGGGDSLRPPRHEQPDSLLS